MAGAEDAPQIWKFYMSEYAPDEPWNRSTLLCLDTSSWVQRYYKSYYSVSQRIRTGVFCPSESFFTRSPDLNFRI